MDLTTRRGRNRLRRMIAGSILLMVLAGCAGNHAATEVTGKVTMNHTPLPGGKVTFVYQDGKTPAVSTIIQGDGQYTLINVPEGEVKISVEGQGRPSVPKQAPSPPVKVPAKYSQIQTSGLSYTVIKGKQTKDLELTSP